MPMIAASVIAVTNRRAVQLMPRLTHHNSAQLITTGTMISRSNGLHRAQRQPPGLVLPASMLTAPPTFTQVPVPSTSTKPGPYAAQALLLPAGLTGSSLSGFADLRGF